MTKEAMEVAKKKIADPIKEAYPKIEDKIKGLSGDVATKAKTKFDEVKKLVEDFLASPGDKMSELGTKLTDAFGELKKMVGL